jgi:PAS domain-containing protein
MAGSPDEEKALRTTVLETANIVVQIRQRAEQEIRRANEILEQQTRALSQALVTMRATLESTTDAILVTDELKVAEFNQKYIDMWKVPRGILEGGNAGEVRQFKSQNFVDPEGFSPASMKLSAQAKRASTSSN